MCKVRLLAISAPVRSGFDQIPYITQLSAYFTHAPFPASPWHRRVSATFKILKLLNLIKLNKTRSPGAARFALAGRPESFFFPWTDQKLRAKPKAIDPHHPMPYVGFQFHCSPNPIFPKWGRFRNRILKYVKLISIVITARILWSVTFSALSVPE
ncbi:hypothetical protein ALO78_200227 [Pseudomonas amygdali pv. ciccaronei]|nr:hypothetical protein ALO78_200227 [Pseudomonas amygdali pv. ciccaronei]